MARKIPVLEEKYRSRISRFFTPSVVGQKEFDQGMQEVALHQSAFDKLLVDGEKLISIIPGFSLSKYIRARYEGIALLTSIRTIWFGKAGTNHVMNDDIGTFSPMVMPDGHFMVAMSTKHATLFSRFTQQKNQASKNYWAGTILVEFSRKPLLDDFRSHFNT